jgi:pantoate--beta-alanine ligase
VKPLLVKTIKGMRKISRELKGTIGFVPTMGYFHEGHLSLVKESQKDNNYTIVSIYVNPSQFGPNEDFLTYPRDIERDISLLKELDVDYIFFPSDKEMYPEDYKTWVNVDKITQILCGKSRPAHFKGVTTIVAKLMNIVNPDKMYLGEKDFQQLKIINQMAKDLNFRTQVIGCPIIREKDGLAKSSRNKYLSPEARKNALCLYKSLQLAQERFKKGIIDSRKIISEMTDVIKTNNGIIDYIEVVDSNTLENLSELEKGCRILLAVKIEKIRLIDNIEIK